MLYYFKEKVTLVHSEGTIFDQLGNEIYTYYSTKQLRPELHLVRDGQEVGTVKTKPSWFRQKYDLFFHGQYAGELHTEKSFIKAKLSLDMMGWKIEGSARNWDFQIADAEDNIIAEIRSDMWHMSTHYAIKIIDEEYEEMLLLVIMGVYLYYKAVAAAAAAAA